MRKKHKKVKMKGGLGWIKGFRGQEQDMSSLVLEWEPFSSDSKKSCSTMRTRSSWNGNHFSSDSKNSCSTMRMDKMADQGLHREFSPCCDLLQES